MAITTTPQFSTAAAYLSWWEDNQIKTGQYVSCHDVRVWVEPGVFNPDPALTRSTKMMMEALPDLTAHRVLDVGTGTGILSLYAARKGAADITAIDCDGLAIRNADRNFTEAHLNGAIALHRGDFLRDVHSTYDVILANLPIVDAAWPNLNSPAVDIAGSFLADAQFCLTPDGVIYLPFASFGDEGSFTKMLAKEVPGAEQIAEDNSFGIRWTLHKITKQNFRG